MEAKLLLRDARVPGGRQVLSMPQTATVDELLDRVCEMVDTDPDATDLIVGLPPAPLHLDALKDGEKTLAELKLPPNEQIRLQAKDLAGLQAQGEGKYRKTRRTSGSAPPVRKTDALAAIPDFKQQQRSIMAD